MREIGRVLGVLLGCLLSSWVFAASKPPRIQLSDGYVAQAECTQCHAQQSRDWQGSDHSWSMREPTSDNVLGNFDNQQFADEKGLSAQFTQADGKYWITTENEQGKAERFAVAYTFGFYPLQQYLIEQEAGRLQAFTVVWDARNKAQGGQRWYSLYPGERFAPDDALHWTGRYQNWNGMCAQCHSGNLKKNYDAKNDVFSTTWSELSVGCQSCHGPGSAHIDWAKKTSSAQAAMRDKGLQVSFSASNPHGEVEQCGRCHAQQETLGVGPKLGEPLIESAQPTLLTPPAYHVDGQEQGEVFEYASFLQSKMYAAGVSCSHCHNAHTGKLRAEGNDLCSSCHNPAGNPLFPSLLKKDYNSKAHHLHAEGSEGAQCTSCHAPVTRYMGIDGRLDHSFRIPRPDLSIENQAPDACTQCHTDKSPVWAAEQLKQHFGEPKQVPPTRVLQALAHNEGVALNLTAALIKDATSREVIRATAVQQLSSQGAEALPIAQLALQDESAWVRSQAVRSLAQLAGDQKTALVADALADKSLAVRDEAARALADSRAQLTPGQQRQLDQQIAALSERLLSNADLPGMRFNYAALLELQGKNAEAIEQYRRVLLLDPDFVAARVALARLLSQTQLVQAMGVLDAGLQRGEARAGYADLAYAQALLKVQFGQLQEALPLLQSAWQGQPQNSRIAYNLALLQYRMGHTKDALILLQQQLQAHPDDVEWLYLAAYMQARIAPLQALRFAERALSIQPDYLPALKLKEALLKMQKDAR